MYSRYTLDMLETILELGAVRISLQDGIYTMFSEQGVTTGTTLDALMTRWDAERDRRAWISSAPEYTGKHPDELIE